MSKKPITILFSDTHLDKDNEEHVKDIFCQIILKAVEMKVSTVYGLGDFFDKFEAICARMSANNKYGFHKNHGK